MSVYMLAFSPEKARNTKVEPVCLLALSTCIYTTELKIALTRAKKNHQPLDCYAIVELDMNTAEVKSVKLASEFKES